jgi:hypothetical protein
LQHAFRILQHIIVPEAQHCDALRGQVSRALRVVRSLLWFGMLPAIQLDGEFRLMAIEVDEIGAEWMLAAEAVAEQLILAQQLPQQVFRIRCIFA